jgi:dipeptidase D
MTTQITELEPKRLYHYFRQINSIPRCSKHEHKVGEYLLALAKEKGLEADRDETGNVVVRVPASPGKENAPVIVLQGHTDMVCEKNKDTQHDFSSDPIAMRINGEWIEAEGTTLGADNGIGISAALAIIDEKEAIHGPLELLFTVDEETGLTGATKLSNKLLTGRKLINMDSEEEGVLYIGCAGGKDTVGTFSPSYTEVRKEYKAIRVLVGGLKGGHSGIDIHLGRANAIKILAGVLDRIFQSAPFHLAAIEGGSKRNAIPREAEAVLFVEPRSFETIQQIAEDLTRDYQSDYSSTDPHLKVSVEEVSESYEKMVLFDSTSTLIGLLTKIPHGVIAMSADVPGLVETSMNLATVVMQNGSVVIGTSQRSSIDGERDALSEKVAQLFADAGAKPRFTDGYPGWKPDLQSGILKATRKIFTEYYEKEPEVKAIHAGLECGIIGEKYPGMEMISFGPTITGPHSPDERVHIPSVKNFYICLLLILKRLAEAND